MRMIWDTEEGEAEDEALIGDVDDMYVIIHGYS
jgi:hypothetical protein